MLRAGAVDRDRQSTTAIAISHRHQATYPAKFVRLATPRPSGIGTPGRDQAGGQVTQVADDLG